MRPDQLDHIGPAARARAAEPKAIVHYEDLGRWEELYVGYSRMFVGNPTDKWDEGFVAALYGDEWAVWAPPGGGLSTPVATGDGGAIAADAKLRELYPPREPDLAARVAELEQLTSKLESDLARTKYQLDAAPTFAAVERARDEGLDIAQDDLRAFCRSVNTARETAELLDEDPSAYSVALTALNVAISRIDDLKSANIPF